MLRNRNIFLSCAVLSLALLGAGPYQAADSFNIPWWVWLVVVAVFLLLTFGIILTFDWNDATNRNRDEDETE